MLVPDEELFIPAQDPFTEPLNSNDAQIYSSMPGRVFSHSFMSKNLMLKRNFKDCPAPTCIKYMNMIQNLKQKNYKYKVRQMLDSQKGVIAEVIKRKSKTMPSFSFGSKKSQEPVVPQYTGFPLKFFEDQTYLERIAEWFTTVPHYLDSAKLKDNRDPESDFHGKSRL